MDNTWSTFNSIISGYCSEGADRDRSMSGDSTALKIKSISMHHAANEKFSIDDTTAWINESIDEHQDESKDETSETVAQNTTTVEISVHLETPTSPPAISFSPTTIITTSSSVDTLNGETTVMHLLSGPSSPSNLSSVTLVGSTGSGSAPNDTDKFGSQEDRQFKYSHAPTSPLPERKYKQSQEINKIESEPKADTFQQKVTDSESVNKTVKKPELISFKPKIVSALAKTGLKDEGSRSAQSSPFKTSSNVLQPMSYLTMNRRPSAGTIGVPVAALTQHRRSLQLNSSEGGFGLSKVIIKRMKRHKSFEKIIFVKIFRFPSNEVVQETVDVLQKQRKNLRKHCLEHHRKIVQGG